MGQTWFQALYKLVKLFYFLHRLHELKLFLEGGEDGVCYSRRVFESEGEVLLEEGCYRKNQGLVPRRLAYHIPRGGDTY